jgi:hypothetical protein
MKVTFIVMQTEYFLTLKFQILVSNSVSKATEIFLSSNRLLNVSFLVVELYKFYYLTITISTLSNFVVTYQIKTHFHLLFHFEGIQKCQNRDSNNLK